MIDPDSHLLLHRLRQQARDRHLGHLAPIRTARDSADAVPLTNFAVSSLWQRLLRSGRRRSARGPTTPGRPSTATHAQAIPTVSPHGTGFPEGVGDGGADGSAATAPAHY
jgi:hypothetical protein